MEEIINSESGGMIASYLVDIEWLEPVTSASQPGNVWGFRRVKEKEEGRVQVNYKVFGSFPA